MKKAWMAVPVVMALSGAPSLAQFNSFMAAEQAGKADPAYEAARKALDEGRWEEALKQFRELAKRGGDKADASFYWEAYAQSKLSQVAPALGTLQALKMKFPHSRWLNDAKALELELRQASGQKVAPESVGSDEDLKLMALNGLMQSDPEQALPVLERTLTGKSSDRVKERALFVLSQSNSPKARAIVARIARGDAQPELRKKALRNLALFGGEESRKELSAIYAASNDLEIKKEILRCFMMNGDKARMSAAARGEASPELRREAIQLLGAMGDLQTLSDMYASEQNVATKERILQGLFTGGGVDRLIELARVEKDPKLQRAQIRFIGLSNSKKGAEFLMSLYTGNAPVEVKTGVVEALFLQGDAKGMVELARKETNPALKKALVEKLSIMNSKESAAFMMELLDK